VGSANARLWVCTFPHQQHACWINPSSSEPRLDFAAFPPFFFCAPLLAPPPLLVPSVFPRGAVVSFAVLGSPLDVADDLEDSLDLSAGDLEEDDALEDEDAKDDEDDEGDDDDDDDESTCAAGFSLFFFLGGGFPEAFPAASASRLFVVAVFFFPFFFFGLGFAVPP
jgi:hypothetical protein